MQETVESKEEVLVLDSVPLGGGKLDVSAQTDKWNNTATVHDGKNIPKHGRYRTYKLERSQPASVTATSLSNTESQSNAGLRVRTNSVPEQEGLLDSVRERRKYGNIAKSTRRSRSDGLCWDKYQNVWIASDKVFRDRKSQEEDYSSKVRQRPIRRSGMKWDRVRNEWIDPTKTEPKVVKTKQWNKVKSAWVSQRETDQDTTAQHNVSRNVVTTGESMGNEPPKSPVKWCRKRSQWVDKHAPRPVSKVITPRNRNQGHNLHQGGSGKQYFVAGPDAAEWSIADSLPISGVCRGSASPRRRRFFTTHKESGGLFVYVRDAVKDDGGVGATVKQALSFQEKPHEVPSKTVTEIRQRHQAEIKVTNKINQRTDRFLARPGPAKPLPRGYVLHQSQIVLG